jgi:hypothetical protein
MVAVNNPLLICDGKRLVSASARHAFDRLLVDPITARHRSKLLRGIPKRLETACSIDGVDQWADLNEEPETRSSRSDLLGFSEAFPVAGGRVVVAAVAVAE